jgi:integrase/recombinase XerD
MILHKPKYKFHSVFASYIRDYIELKSAIGGECVACGNTLRQFDQYCCEKNVAEPSIDETLANDWLMLKSNEKHNTHTARISALKGFSDYLASVGKQVDWHPHPGYTARSYRYVPYIFTKEELTRIFTAADALPKPYGASCFHLVFPAVLRVLYGCGLRISEALSLKNKDVDLVNGFLYIRKAKFGKSRRLPVSDSLLSSLRKYRNENTKLIGVCEDGYFFPNAYGELYSHRTVYDKFRQILWASGIPHQGRGKGPRVHDMRHTFAVHSLQQNVEQGKDIYVALTGLMVYLGHSKITSTEYYLRLTSEVFPDFLRRTDAVCAPVIPEVVCYEK